MKKRYLQIDILKGVLILMVLVAHSDYFFMKNHTDIAEWLTVQAMPIFFFISGFFAMKDSFDKVKFMQRMSNLTLSLLWPTIVCFVLYVMFAGGDFFKAIVDEMKFGYWFTYTLFFISMSFAFSLYYSSRNSLIKSVFSTILIGLIIIGLIAVKLIGDVQAGWFKASDIGMVIKYYPVFLFGVLCRIYLSEVEKFFSNPIIFWSVFLIWVCTELLCFVPRSQFVPTIAIYRYAPMFAAPFFVFASMKYLSGMGRCGNFFEYVGKNTLKIYLLHYFIILALQRWFPMLLQHVSEWVYIPTLLTIVIVLLLGTLALMWVLKVVRLENILFPKRNKKFRFSFNHLAE